MNRIQTTIGIFEVIFLTTMGHISVTAAEIWASETAELSPAAADMESPDRPHLDELLAQSQLTYQADGGFTKVESYNVIVSCVKGRVSVLTSIHDPRLPTNRQIRKVGQMPVERYIALWNNLEKQGVLRLHDAVKPNCDIADEFTIHFKASVGGRQNSFEVAGIGRPEVAHYFALRQLIDDAVGMSALWDQHQELVKALEIKSNSN